jgi:hypothetical protein
MPEFNVVTIHKLLCLFGGVVVVVTFERNCAEDPSDPIM